MTSSNFRRGASVVSSKPRAAAIGVLLLAVTAVVVGVSLESPKGIPFEKETFVKAAFNDVQGLRDGAEVRVGQVRAGRVSAIALDGDHAVVTLEIRSPEVRHVYRNATAVVTNRSLLGQKFVELRPGVPSAGELPEGAVIPASQTQSSTQLLELLQVFDGPTRRATAGSLQELGNGAAGHAADLRDAIDAGPEILPDLGAVSRALAVRDGADFISMMRSLESLSRRFEGRGSEIKELTSQFADTLDAIGVDEGRHLEDTLGEAPESMRELRTALVRLQEPLRSTDTAMTSLRPGAQALATATLDLRGVLREGIHPLRKVPGVSGLAQPAMGDLTHVVRDARPLAHKFAEAVTLAASPLSVLGPYSPEIAAWFTNWNAALSDADSGGHWLRFTVVPATDSVTGNLPGRDPLTNSDAYPEPGQAPGQAEPQLPLPDVEGGQK